MLVLIPIGLVAGIVSAISPCVLPILPLVLGGSLSGGKRRPLGIVIGLVVSFVVFTLTLTTALTHLGLSATTQRRIAVGVLVAFGLSLMIPALDAKVAALLAPVARFGDRLGAGRQGFGGGIVLGVALGLVWTPCAGAVLAGITTAVASNRVGTETFLVLTAYAVGAAIPLLLLATGGQAMGRRLAARAVPVRAGMGVLMIATGALIAANLDTRFTTWATNSLPSYTDTLQAAERTKAARSGLDDLAGRQGPGFVEQAPAAKVTKRAAPRPEVSLPDLGLAPELQGISAWFNTDDRPLTLASLRGRVVLLDFWTYSCVNCLRTLPHLEALDRAYRAKGLTILGVHTPEFAFEKDPGNVSQAVRDLGVRYPVALDPAYGTWNAYHNAYWPAEFLIDKQGHVREYKVGEGGYGETEAHVRALLGEPAEATRVSRRVPDTEPTGASTLTPESYLGYTRLARFATPDQVRPDRAATYRPPEALKPDQLAYGGVWTVHGEDIQAGTGAEIDLSFQARHVYLVLGSTGGPRTGQVLVDGRPAGRGVAGADVSPGGRLVVAQHRLYSLVSLQGPRSRHRLQVRLAPGTQAFAFTFG